jgi:hypothetical protein
VGAGALGTVAVGAVWARHGTIASAIATKPSCRHKSRRRIDTPETGFTSGKRPLAMTNAGTISQIRLGQYSGMLMILTVLVGLGMAATLGTLIFGMIGVARKDGDGARSNKLMRLRVIFQGITIALFALLVLASQH